MSAAGRPWRERRVVDGLADALREAASERFLGNGRTPAKAASATGASAGAGATASAPAAAGPSEADRVGRSERFGR